MKTILVILALVSVASAGQWRCSINSQDAVRLTTEVITWGPHAEETTVGNIYVNGKIVAEHTHYSMHGLQHRWDWGWNEEGEGYDNSLFVTPDGYGLYFDFSQTAPNAPTSPTLAMKCHQ